MRHLILSACIILAASVAFAGCSKSAPPPSAATGETPVIAQKTCPVMGDPINPKIFVDYKGRRIYFCCEMCPPAFNKDPEKYIKIVDEQIKAQQKPAPK